LRVKDLLEEINRCKDEYDDNFLDWDIYTEQISELDKEHKRQRGWLSFKDSEDWEYFKCAGFWTKSPDKKIFTINVNY